MKLLPDGRRGGGKPPREKTEGDTKSKEQIRGERTGRGPAKKIVRLVLPLIIAAGALCAWLFFGSGDPGNRVNGMNVRIPEGFSRTFRDSDCTVWTYEGTDRRPGPMVITTGIRGSHAQVFRTAEELLFDCPWLKEAEIYVNPHGVRMARGYSMDYSGYPEYRYYVETPSAVFLISMSENTEYYMPGDCESFLQETADGISPA